MKIDLASKDISIAKSDSNLSDLKSRSISPSIPDSLYESSNSQISSPSREQEKKIQNVINRKALLRVSPLGTIDHSMLHSIAADEYKTMVQKNNIFKTKVEIQYPNNDVYKGEMKDGMRHGLGEFKDYVKRRIYKGYFLNDYFHGKGKLKYPDGKVYEGEFKKGIRRGRGICYYRVESNIDIYVKEENSDPRRVKKQNN